MAIDQLLKRNFWAVNLGLIGLAALFGARGLVQIIGMSMAADEQQLAQPPLLVHSAPVATGASQHATNADPILSRNPFDSVTGSLTARPEVEEAGAPLVDNTDPMNAPPCDGVKVLIIAQSTDPEWSFVALETPTDTKSVLRRKGGEFGGKTVEYIGYNPVAGVPVVWMTSNGSRCQAKMFAPVTAAAAAPVASAAPPPPAPGGPPGVPDDIRKGVVRVSANEFNVDRGIVDKILENQAELMKQARIVPEQENGKVVGIRLYGVRSDTLLGVLGMENGDRLQTINGFDMTSPEKALEAYARLRTADHLTIQVNRKGANQNLDYNIK